MACPFVEDPVDVGAQIVRAALRRERVFQDRSDPLTHGDDVLFERYGFSRAGLAYLCELLEPHVGRATRRSAALTVPQTVCTALRFYATGSFMCSAGDAERVSKNSACRAVHQVSAALTHLMDDFIRFPGHLPPHRVQDAFHAIAGFPRVLGCVAGVLVPISASLGEEESDYVDQHHGHSLNVQITCDSDCVISSLDARWPGSVQDQRVFEESALCRRLQRGDFSGVLLGGGGYALRPFLLTPYADPDPGPQSRYNAAHRRTRVRIDNTVRLLKARFRCLRCLRVAPGRACKIIAACCVLHNIAAMRKEREPRLEPRPPGAVTLEPRPPDAVTLEPRPPDAVTLEPRPPDAADAVTLEHPLGRAARDAVTLLLTEAAVRYDVQIHGDAGAVT